MWRKLPACVSDVADVSWTRMPDSQGRPVSQAGSLRHDVLRHAAGDLHEFVVVEVCFDFVKSLGQLFADNCMKIVSIPAIWALCLTSVIAQAPKAAVAKPATIAPSSAEPAKPTGLITSDIAGRDLTFIAQAIDLGKAMTYLARQAGRTEKPELRGFGDDLVKSLAAQGAVLATLAEMRQVSVPAGDSVTQKSIAARLEKLGGVKLEKAILDTFIDLDRRLIAAY